MGISYVRHRILATSVGDRAKKGEFLDVELSHYFIDVYIYSATGKGERAGRKISAVRRSSVDRRDEGLYSTSMVMLVL